MAKILVVEDEPSLQKVLEYNLKQTGHDVVLTASGKQALDLSRDEHPELVILDLMLPDGSGMDVCRALSRDDRTRDVPIMIVSAKGDEVDRVAGFELGASDYVVKPFSVRELMLRVQALLRRARGRAKPNPIFQTGNLRIDPEAHRVWVDQKEIELTLLEFKLLLTLYQLRERVQTRTSLLDGVWGFDVDVTTRTVDTHVKRLRDKLGPAGAYIETVRGVGYRFAAHPRVLTPQNEDCDGFAEG